jgi:hypothetical protein
MVLTPLRLAVEEVEKFIHALDEVIHQKKSGAEEVNLCT